MKLFNPSFESITAHARELSWIEGETLIEPRIPRHKGALRRLFRTANQVRRKKLCQRGIEFSLRIGLTVRRQEKPRLVLFTRKPTEQIGSIVEQEMPFALACQLCLMSSLNELGQVRRRRLLRLGGSREEKADQEDEQNMHEWRQHAAQGSGQ